MSVTALVFMLIYFTGLILTFYRPYYGILTYIFEWHNHPPYFWWGDELPDLRWSYTIALATLISWIIHRQKLAPQAAPSYRPMIWMGLMSLNMLFVSGFFAVLPELSYEKALEMFKMLVMFFLIVTLVRTHKDYQQLIWLILVCVGYMGFIALDGSNRDIGVIAPNATEENALSAHVMAILPFFGVYFLRAPKAGKVLLALLVPLCLNLIILANSRATVVGLLAIGVMSIFLIKGKFRFAAILGLVAGAFLFFQLTNEDFHSRQTTETYDDGSANSRLHIWGGGWEMWKDHPFGVGGGGFIELSMDYIPEIYQPKSQHNTFVAVFTDWGFLGIILYLGFLIHVFLLTIRVKKFGKIPSLRLFSLDATAVQLALIGLAAAGIFHSRQYSEVVYWLCAFAVVLHNIQNTEIADMESAATEEPAEVSENRPAVIQN